MRTQHPDCSLHGMGGPSLEQQRLLALERHPPCIPPSSSSPLPLQVRQDRCLAQKILSFSGRISAIIRRVTVC